jgi:PAS domain S-box-containing protein
VLHRADAAILESESAEQLVSAVLPLVAELVASPRISVLSFDLEAGEATVLDILTEDDCSLQPGVSIPIGEDWHLDSLKEEPFRVFDDLSAVPISPDLSADLEHEDIRAYFAVPLVAQDQLLGVLNLALNNAAELGPRRREVLRQLADQLAIGIRQNRLHEQVQQYNEKLEEMVAWRTASLRASEARFRAIFSQTALGIAVLDEEGRIINCNPALEQILGIRRETLRGRVLTEFASPQEDIRTDVSVYGQMLADEREHHSFKTRFQGADGQTGWANVILSTIDDENEDSNLVAAMVEDVTEQVLAQQALIRSEKLAVMGRVSASLAHEINNPLQSVIGCLGLADEMLTGEDDVRRFVRIAIEELENAAEIVNQLRDLGREPEPLEMEPVDLKELVDKTLFLTGKRLREEGIKTIWEAEADLPLVSGAPDRLRQVFLNLVLNAAEAMPEGGRLEIDIAKTEKPEGVRLRFRDTGVGIAAENIERLFEPFFSTRAGGMGMGLYVCRKFVQAHGGTIEVDSRPGEGTTFAVWLPAGEE